ncbi:hypothetical protein NMY3_00450 [Candidatus Nitrosocosmicus oleophilus]|uniref:Uncharacterized protein n=1 Tax=Candidatus Nitrosocosmicus oleophilus TaxID=1353260 RepID=A0A654LWF4_9ARCH|nr:hypothetical protein NMY3_00450 [Candidatus Nitrosocosmicus oleophilus]
MSINTAVLLIEIDLSLQRNTILNGGKCINEKI